MLASYTKVVRPDLTQREVQRAIPAAPWAECRENIYDTLSFNGSPPQHSMCSLLMHLWITYTCMTDALNSALNANPKFFT
mmetsp:Transcript_2882/g.8496  ORF Transcript_2882/g.8496 Transcript_2882/m.8496 type:complete len:80 (-) Transcript_2882:3080-3319(-)